jgi:hypothetical protein
MFRLESLEDRLVLSNGLVGVAAEITPPTHIFTVTSVPEDPGNTGVVPSTTVTIIGNVENPLGGPISSIHTTLEIDAFLNGTLNDSVTWDVTSGPGTSTPPKFFGQDPTHQNQADFSIPVTLQSGVSTVQNVTFQIIAMGFGTRNVVLQSNTSQKLTGTFTVQSAAAGPTVTAISQPTTPRTTPVDSINVTFSKAIDPTTFTTAALTLTNTGTPVTLGPEVTFTSTNNTTFTVGGLTGDTTALGTYVFTVDATRVKDSSGTAGTGSQSVTFTVQSPSASTGAQVVKVQRFGFHTQPTSVVITFDRALDPTSASNPAGYEILAPGNNNGVPVPIVSATYNPMNLTVTLAPAHQLSLFNEYLLIVRGTGPNAILDASGVALDGKANGQPGSDFMTVIGPRNLAGPASAAPSDTAVKGFPNGSLAFRLTRTEILQARRWVALIRSGRIV